MYLLTTSKNFSASLLVKVELKRFLPCFWKLQQMRWGLMTPAQWWAKLWKTSQAQPHYGQRQAAPWGPREVLREKASCPMEHRGSCLCVTYSELRNLNDPRKDFHSKQYSSRHNSLLLFFFFFYFKWELFCWVAECSQNKQTSQLWHVQPTSLAPFQLPPVSKRSDSPGWSCKLPVATCLPFGGVAGPARKEKETERVGRPRRSPPNKG